MNEDLPTPVPLTESIPSEDVMDMLRGLAPGNYTTRDLYPRYQAWAEREKKPVKSAQRLGMALKRVTPSGRFAHGHARTWHVTTAVLAGRHLDSGRDWFVSSID
jgi:hypothetical protein